MIIGGKNIKHDNNVLATLCRCSLSKSAAAIPRRPSENRKASLTSFTRIPHSFGRVLPSVAAIGMTPSSDAPSPWMVLGAFVGLPAALWAYKCLMMVLFQRKIIYMGMYTLIPLHTSLNGSLILPKIGYVPPSARTEQLTDDTVRYSPKISCEEVRIKSDPGVTIYGLLVSRTDIGTESPETVVIYLQGLLVRSLPRPVHDNIYCLSLAGNAGNPLGRIPVFERLLLSPSFSPEANSRLENTAILAIAPRSYWKSSSRTPTERGITSDYVHAIDYAKQRFPSSSIILYGHSLGGAVAICLSSQLSADKYPSVRGLILENPFASIPGMVKALYPQRWLPYRYLSRFAFDKWDALTAMQTAPTGSLLAQLAGRTLVILSKKDEIVPNEMGESLFRAAVNIGTIPKPYSDSKADESALRRLIVIDSALHENAWQDRKWRTVVCGYITTVQNMVEKVNTPKETACTASSLANGTTAL